MSQSAVDYLLSLRDSTGGSIVFPTQSQVIIPNFPPLTTINYSVAPLAPIEALILYQYCFGEAMVPHAFDVKMQFSGGYIFNAIVSGQFTTIPTLTFVLLRRQQPSVQITATNLRLLVNYYELTFNILGIRTQDNYDIVIDALRRMHTSTRSEQLAQQSSDLLRAIAEGSAPGALTPQPSIGGRR